MKYILQKANSLSLLHCSSFLFSPSCAFQVIPGYSGQHHAGHQRHPGSGGGAARPSWAWTDPVLIRYGRWVSDFVQGDWGTSYSYNMPVKDMVMAKAAGYGGAGPHGLRASPWPPRSRWVSWTAKREGELAG